MNKDKVRAIRLLLGYTTDLRVKLPNTIVVRSNISRFIDTNMALFNDVRYSDDEDMFVILLHRYTRFVIDPSLIDEYM